MGNLNNFITRICERSKIALNIIAVLAGFLCYFCMYAYRKPFAAGIYEGYSLWGVDFKILGISLQIIGYTISKFTGIKIVSEIRPKYRGICIASFMTASEIVLIIFGLVPAPYNAIVMFFNGLPLGQIWGLAFSYLEGRKTSALLGSGMGISFIVASGAVKSVGRSLLNTGINQFWMPAAVGGIFYIPMIISVLVLESIPPPDAEDVACRTERVVMENNDRIKFCKIFGPGVGCMIFFNMFLVAYRDFRDNFAPELWDEFGYGGEPSIFSISEIIVAFVVCIPIGLFMLIKSPLHTLIAYHILIIGGSVLIGLCGLLNNSGKLPGLYYMVIAGIGLYFGYVPFNSIIFDALIAAFHYKANSGFLSYVCDSMGYLSSVVILFVKNFGSAHLSWLQFFRILSYTMTIVAAVFLTLAILFCIWKYKHWKSDEYDDENLEEDIIKIKKLGKNGVVDETEETKTSTLEENYTEDFNNNDGNIDDNEELSISSISQSDSNNSINENIVKNVETA